MIHVVILLQSWLHSFSRSFDRNFHHINGALEATGDKLRAVDGLKSTLCLLLLLLLCLDAITPTITAQAATTKSLSAIFHKVLYATLLNNGALCFVFNLLNSTCHDQFVELNVE